MQDQIEFLRRELERKDAILLRMAERIPELEPASEPREAPETATVEEAEQQHRRPPEEPRRGFWRRLLGS
jgi:hypothetical protein